MVKLLVLSTLMKKLGTFGMTTFESRLIFQKLVYFLQEFGIDLGYRYSWYIYGPYSTDLTRDGFELASKIETLPEKELDKEDKEKFEQFLVFIDDKKTDSRWLEALASIHFLKRRTSLKKTEIIEFVKKKQPYFEKQTCLKAWERLEKFKMV